MTRAIWTRRLLTTVAGAAAAALVLAGPAAAAGGHSPGGATASGAAAAGPAVKPVSPASPTGKATRPNVIAKPTHRRPGLTPFTVWNVNLTASPNWLWPTQLSTLVATASQDVGPTPYYLSIYDQTAGAYVTICGAGSTCTASVTQPTPTTHAYIALVSYYPSSYPPAGEQAYSNAWVTWQGVFISLSASPTTLPVGGTTTLTATTSTDIGPSPFYTEIYDATTGTRIGVCGIGTSCSATASQSVATTHRYIAYLSMNSTAYPPAGLQETSGSSFVTWSNTGWSVSLTAPAATFSTETVTATANADVGPTPYWIEIFDENGTRLAACGSGTTCTVPAFTPSFNGSNLVAFVSSFDTALPPANTQASSNAVTTYERIIP